MCSHIKDGVCLETTKMRIKVKTDRHGLPIALSPSNYVFCSHKRVSIGGLQTLRHRAKYQINEFTVLPNVTLSIRNNYRER